MKQLILAILFCLPSGIAFADANCEAEFRDLLQQKHEGYPYKGKATTIYGEQSFEGIGMSAGPYHSYGTDLKTGISTLFHGLRMYQSSDGDKTWNKIATLPADTEETTTQMHLKQSKSATDITCAEAETYNGKTYRTVQGYYISGSTIDHQIFQKYYMEGPRGVDAVWWVRVSESTISGQKSIVTHEKIATDEPIVVPTID